MVEPQINLQPVLNEIGLRIREGDERSKVMRDRLLLIGKNLVSIKEETDKDMQKLKRENEELKREFEKIKRAVGNLVTLTDRFAKRDEMILLERMLSDFQPLEFMRKKDVEELLEHRLRRTTHG